jgi:glyoxylase-like metal-dependent hydrolase (beta-lactamase superfamily II)
VVLKLLPRIERLDLSVVTLPDWHPEAPNQTTAPVYGYVVVHPDGPIVFDTGVGFGNAFIDEVYKPESTQLTEALDRVGVDVSSTVGVVNSHLHFDHCGQNPLLFGTGVPFFLRQAEVDQVERDRFYTDQEWALPPVAQRRMVDGDLEIAEGVTILSTPGHTPGHQSVLIESALGRVVFAGQAVWELREFLEEQATVSNVFSDEFVDVAVDSIRRIKALKPDVVHFAHCAAHRTNAALRSAEDGGRGYEDNDT